MKISDSVVIVAVAVAAAVVVVVVVVAQTISNAPWHVSANHYNKADGTQNLCI